MHCLYNAKTELYDRSLTDMRNRYDPTSAYLASNDMRSRSNLYAYNLYQWCKRQIEYETGMPFDLAKWKESTRRYENMSAQWWIGLYIFLLRGEYGEDKYRKLFTVSPVRRRGADADWRYNRG